MHDLIDKLTDRLYNVSLVIIGSVFILGSLPFTRVHTLNAAILLIGKPFFFDCCNSPSLAGFVSIILGLRPEFLSSILPQNIVHWRESTSCYMTQPFLLWSSDCFIYVIFFYI